VRRFLGPEVGDALTVQQTSALVPAALPSLTFEAAEQSFRTSATWQGTADVRIQRERILLSLLTWMKTLWEKWGG
jgi:autotransporter translocation and assembly factor TamB